MSAIKMDIQRYKSLRGDVTEFKFKDYFKVLSPRLFCVFLFRLASACAARRVRFLASFLSLVNFLLFKVEISPQCKIGGGLFLPHPSGIIIGADSIGNNCTIFQNVTIGARHLDIHYTRELRPRIGNDVSVSSGAVIVGGIEVGDNSIVAANSVVTKDVPRGSVVGGIPARLLKPRNE